ncbi:hypothetical protein RRG08_038705 [Elysia crispata]|uniref:Uncharacterized protein n=1 Tax=Elysia crispata TaxID=231223 RepID=A0AAE0ZIR7_9GAST|nr:hypothetical protein RRG08_038705 [Elysia crispata]
MIEKKKKSEQERRTVRGQEFTEKEALQKQRGVDRQISHVFSLSQQRKDSHSPLKLNQSWINKEVIAPNPISLNDITTSQPAPSLVKTE